MVQRLKRMQYFTGSQSRKYKRGLVLLKRDALQTTCARQFFKTLQSFNVTVRKIIQKGITLVKMTSNLSTCNIFCSFWAKVLPNTPKVLYVIEAYFASLGDLLLEVKITIKNEFQISN